MIVSTVCTDCQQPYRINIEPEDIPLVKQVVDEETKTCPCPRLCGGSITIVAGSKTESSRVFQHAMELTGKDLYRAVNGAGLPDELPKSMELITALLKTYPVKDVEVEDLGNRFYLHSLTLSNGSVVHLCAGGHGAQVLKVTRQEKSDGPAHHH